MDFQFGELGSFPPGATQNLLYRLPYRGSNSSLYQFPVTKPLAVVSGAGSGIGRACAQALGEHGFAVAAIDLDESTLTRQMAVVYGARGITVNCVCPGGDSH